MTDQRSLRSTHPRSGRSTETGIRASTVDDVDAVARAASAAHRELLERSRGRRAELLDALADALDVRVDDLAAIADEETALGADRLRGEVARSSFQFRLFAEAIRDGAYLDAAVDHAASTSLGPAPDVRSMLVPLPVVAVFGSSNFPFAFSTAGGDVASALAAGAAVVVKAHSSHLRTSQRTHEVLRDALVAAGAPPGLLGIVYGTRAGIDLVQHPEVAAVGFTGSTATARILRDAIAERPTPIPFYGELSSINPLVVTPGAAAARADEIGTGLATSFTLGAGQFCTKPGIAFIPSGADGDRVVAELVERAGATPPMVLLNERIRDAFVEIGDRLGAVDGVSALVGSGGEEGSGFSVGPAVYSVPISRWSPGLAEERFGPSIVVIRYDAVAEAVRVIGELAGSLTASIHFTDDERAEVESFVRDVAPRVGRIVFNGYPTGVRVSWAQHHGGPWPATDTQFTSVGVGAIRRFLRPLAFQGAPSWALPLELRDEETQVPRRVDGILTTPAK